MVLAIACVTVAGCASPNSAASASASAADSAEVEAGDAIEQDLTKAKNDLSAKQAADVVDMINGHCGDSWCEGDLDLNFTKLVCDFTARTCTFTVLVTDPGATDAKADDRTFWRSCKMTQVGTKYADIVDTAKNGWQDLSDPFYAKLDACVTKVEDGIPARQ
jgi:hypothetical protein